MKYTAPAVQSTIDATAVIRGGKEAVSHDNTIVEPTNAPGYDADE